MTPPESKTNWALFNPNNKVFVEGLTWLQFKPITRMIPGEEIGSWFYWHEGLKNWAPLRDLEGLPASGTKKKTPLPPLPPQMNTNSEIDIGDASDDEKADRRTTERFTASVKIALVVGTTTYNMQTVDISIGGAKLDQTLPNITVPFRVLLDPEGSKIELEALFLDNSEGANARIQFLPTESLDQLRDYLLGI